MKNIHENDQAICFQAIRTIDSIVGIKKSIQSKHSTAFDRYLHNLKLLNEQFKKEIGFK